MDDRLEDNMSLRIILRGKFKKAATEYKSHEHHGEHILISAYL